MFPLGERKSVVGCQQAHRGVSGERNIGCPQPELRPVTSRHHQDFFDALGPRQLNQSLAAATLTDPEAFANTDRGRTVVQADDH